MFYDDAEQCDVYNFLAVPIVAGFDPLYFLLNLWLRQSELFILLQFGYDWISSTATIVLIE